MMFTPLNGVQNERYEFLGSVNGKDLWMDFDGDVRVVSSDGSWDYFVVKSSVSGTFMLERATNDADLDTKTLFLIKRFLRAFCPDLVERSRSMRIRLYNGHFAEQDDDLFN